MDWWDGVLLLLAGYIAISALGRLMAARRNELIRATREQIQARRSQGGWPAGAPEE